MSFARSFARRIAIIFMSLCLVATFSVTNAQAQHRQTDALELPATVRDQLASSDEKEQILNLIFEESEPHTLEFNGGTTQIYPHAFEDYVVERRSKTSFITYAIRDINADTAVLNLKSIDLQNNNIEEDQYYIFTENPAADAAEVVVQSGHDTIWSGSIDEAQDMAQHQRNERESRAYGTALDACRKSVNSLCAVSGGAGGAIICGLLGLSVVAGIACGGVLALIAMFGCEEAKKRVCRNARG